MALGNQTFDLVYTDEMSTDEAYFSVPISSISPTPYYHTFRIIADLQTAGTGVGYAMTYWWLNGDSTVGNYDRSEFRGAQTSESYGSSIGSSGMDFTYAIGESASYGESGTQSTVSDSTMNAWWKSHNTYGDRQRPHIMKRAITMSGPPASTINVSFFTVGNNQWRTETAVTHINIGHPSSYNLGAGSRITIYGLKRNG